MTADELLARIDAKSCLDFVSRMARHKTYSGTEGERSSLISWPRNSASSVSRPS
jgi:hypothetical protein